MSPNNNLSISAQHLTSFNQEYGDEIVQVAFMAICTQEVAGSSPVRSAIGQVSVRLMLNANAIEPGSFH